MGKTFKSVKEFEFPESFGFKASAGKIPVKAYCRGGPTKGYAKGGHAESKEKASDLKQDKAMIAAGVHKHEAKLHPGKPKTKFADGGVVAPAIVGPMRGRPERSGSREEQAKARMGAQKAALDKRMAERRASPGQRPGNRTIAGLKGLAGKVGVPVAPSEPLVGGLKTAQNLVRKVL